MVKVISTYYIAQKDITAVSTEKIDNFSVGDKVKDLGSNDIFEIFSLDYVRYYDVHDNERFSNFSVKGNFSADKVELIKKPTIVPFPRNNIDELIEM